MGGILLLFQDDALANPLETGAIVSGSRGSFGKPHLKDLETFLKKFLGGHRLAERIASYPARQYTQSDSNIWFLEAFSGGRAHHFAL